MSAATERATATAFEADPSRRSGWQRKDKTSESATVPTMATATATATETVPATATTTAEATAAGLKPAATGASTFRR